MRILLFIAAAVFLIIGFYLAQDNTKVKSKKTNTHSGKNL
jgi:hypothetical protein